MKKPSLWTSREVHFTCFPATTDEAFDKFMDAAIDRYWETWRRRVYGDLGIASSGFTLEIQGWPWWVPAWFARRDVAALAASLNTGGGATFKIERAVLTWT